MNMNKDSFLLQLSVRLGVDYTQEQFDFAKNFTETTMCFASPGTGKTMTAIAGLITAELYDQIPGDNIYALSFTKMATGELSVRHAKACKKIGIKQTVHFRTLHAICMDVLKENCKLLNINQLTVIDEPPMQSMIDLIGNTCQEWGTPIDIKVIPKVVWAIRTLNSSLIFDPVNVQDHIVFKQTKVDYELFNRIRELLFLQCLYTEQICVGDIMLYTLLLMNKFPEVSQKFKQKCKLMLVDEAQDLSLLQLRIISLLADTVIFIGDIKQQIYAFNGACQEVVEQFYKLYPNAITRRLTQSFRCYENIAEYATKVILPNALTQEDADAMPFKGVKEGGVVELTNKFDAGTLVESLRQDYLDNRRNFTKDYLFLFRNNASAIPIAEYLYKAQLPFRVNGYIPVYKLPVVGDLISILLLAQHPEQPMYLTGLKFLMYEFSTYKAVEDMPLYKIMKKTGKSLFEINYQYKNQNEADDAMQLLIELHEMISKGSSVFDLNEKAWRLYSEHYLKSHAFMLKYEYTYYLGLVKELTKAKTLDLLIQEEQEKIKWIQDSIDLNKGIRCYTMHSSKGLEADIVYILDSEDEIIPNKNKLDSMIKEDCAMAAAREIRNERSLCYVAITRAKEACYIQYTKALSNMMQGKVDYPELDELYKSKGTDENDIIAFEQFSEVALLVK